jgi:hypothetical protein
MKNEDYDEFCELIDLIAEQYSKPLSNGMKMLYWQELYDKDYPAVKTALFNHLRNPDNGQFMPKVADIIRMIDGSSEDSGMIAWAKVDKELRSKGTYVSVVFDDFLIHAVLRDMGGWVQLGTKTDDEWPFIAKEFITRYRGFKSRNQKPDYPAHLIGLAEMHNAKEGYKIDPPILLGDKEKAKAVQMGGSGMVGFDSGSGLKKLQSDLSKAVGNIEESFNKDFA